jgi:hypothetical protein
VPTLIVLLIMNLSSFTDYRQTVYIARHPEYHEINPILGEHPSVGKVNAYFAAGVVIKNGLFFTLPKKYRIPFGLGMTAISTGLVIHNNSVGIKINF